MKVTVKRISKQITLGLAAFILAISSLSAAAPFVAAERVSAVEEVLVQEQESIVDEGGAETEAVAIIDGDPKTYDTVQGAIDAAGAGQTVKLLRSVNITDAAVTIKKAITFDGGNNTLNGTYSFSGHDSGVGKTNAVLVIDADKVTITNLTVTSGVEDDTKGIKPNGIFIENKKDISLKNVTMSNARTGLVSKGSVVTAASIRTFDNEWYGISLNNGGKLTVTNTSEHTDQNGAIFAEGREGDLSYVVVDDSEARQYVRWDEGEGYIYRLDTEAPQASLTLDQEINPTVATVVASDDQRLGKLTVTVRDQATGGAAVTRVTQIDVNPFTIEYKDIFTELADGTYVFEVLVEDSLQKTAEVFTEAFTIDRSIFSTINSIQLNTPQPTISGRIAYTVGNAPVVGVQVVVVVDGAEYAATTNEAGVWSVAPRVLNGVHDVVVRLFGAESPLLRTSFTTDFMVSAPETDLKKPVGPSFPGVLGASVSGLPLASEDDDVLANTQSGEAIRELSTAKTPAQTVKANSDANKGNFLGFSWYWWIIGIAAIALIGWWVAAAVRRNKDA